MADKFALGEIALVACDVPEGHNNIYGFRYGDEVTIVGVLKPRRFSRGDVCDAYLVSRGDGHSYRAEPQWLRKKPPKQAPHEELGEWELCPWRPLTETVTTEPK